MALLAKGRVLAEDDSPGLCDKAFMRVDTRTPPHLLPPGVAANAVNYRSEDGRLWPRFALDQQAWGLVQALAPLTQPLIPAGAKWTPEAGAPHEWYFCPIQVQNGVTYNFTGPGAASVSVMGVYTAQDANQNPSGQILIGANGNTVAGTFQATFTGTVYLYAFTAMGAPSLLVSQIYQIYGPRPFNVCGYARFQDPQGNDCQVVASDDWRDQNGEDGGRGRAWLIQANNNPVQVPMNGNDIYGIVRLIPCDQALVMLRQGNERHYFQAAAVGGATGTSKIQLNCAPAWVSGDQVLIMGDATENSAFTGGNAPGLGTYCYVKNLNGNVVELFQDAGLAHAYAFTGAIGRFYLERAATQPGFGGNGAPPLICQPGPAGQLMWDAGFTAIPTQYLVQALTGNVISTAIPHRLIPGDTVYFNHAGVNSAQGYAAPTSTTTVILYTTLFDALGNTGNNQYTPTFAGGDYIIKTTAANQPLPPCREGFFTSQGCLAGVTGLNTVIISQPNDPLHYMPLTDVINAALGGNEAITAVYEIPSSDALLIFKSTSVFAMYNFTAGLSNAGQAWTLVPVTREYGCIAPLTIGQVGSSVLFLSRRGVDRLIVNAFGTFLATLLPPSDNQTKYVSQIYWAAAGQACAGTWNKRYLISFPQLGQPAGAAGVMTNAIVGGPQNNQTLSLNSRYTDEGKEDWGWEGLWTGFSVYGYGRLTLAGEGERMTFCDLGGNVNWFSDGWQDYGRTQIPTDFLSRRYTGGTQLRKIWNSALVIWDTYNSQITVTAVAPGVNRSYVMAAGAPVNYPPTAYLQGPNVPAPYNPNTQVPPFNTPFRADYTPQVLGEMMGNALEQEQNITQSFRTRIDTWGIQVRIQNARGYCKIASIMAGGVMGPSGQRLQA